MKILTMDCTLRDGGFLNQWNFGNEVINSFVQKYSNTCIDYIECGYIDGAEIANDGVSKYSTFEQISKCLGTINSKLKLICMIDFGKVNIDSIPDHRDSVIDGIRVAFHKKDSFGAIQYCQKIKDKGYKVFVQPMNTPEYSTSEFKTLVQVVNQLEPYAFYIVDSFGDMWPEDCKGYVDIISNYLSAVVAVGFHFHNSYQQAITNAIYVMSLDSIKHSIILDTTICGVGRGGGNLDIFQLLCYMNVKEKNNVFIPFLEIVDSVLYGYLQEYNCNCKLEYLISAYFHCHPNYAQYLKKIENIRFIDMYNIISQLSDKEKCIFSEKYIKERSQLYFGEKNNEPF